MDAEKNINKQEFEYKAEMKQLLHIIVHSLYTHPEVFLRELVSNASDALNKFRFRRLVDHNILQPESELKIDIKIDKETNLFSIEDSGIGMTKDDLINQIGTVASSGTLQFLNAIKEQKQALDANLIGQFGVGFYSVFMVTDEIQIETRFADVDSKPYRWVSEGEDKYYIEQIEREERGTKISFKIKDEYKEFLEVYKIKEVLKKYSNFVDFPIYVNGEKVNTISALWHRKKDDIKDEELDEFYKYISNDYEVPLGHLHLSIEGNINFKALLFVPKTAPPMLFKEIGEKSLQLYTNKVFIQDDCKELLPDYLKFVKGVVDTEDLPLNVSREVIQSSPLIAKMRNVLTGKILTYLEEWAGKDEEKYNTFFKAFGSVFKTGANSDFTNKDRIVELFRFESSNSSKGELTSFNGYVSRLKPDQTEIYYVSGATRDVIEQNPNLEYFKKKEIEVIYLTDPVDIFTFPYIMEYDKKPLKSIDKADIDLSKFGDTAQDNLNEDLSKSLIVLFKEVLGDKVEDVTISKRLIDSPATLVVGKQGMDTQLEKMMQMLDKEFTASKRILEINTSHPLIKNLSKLHTDKNNNELLMKSINVIYEGALLIEGYLNRPNDFVKSITEIMEVATK